MNVEVAQSQRLKYCYENARLNLQVICIYVCNCLLISQSFCPGMNFYARILLRPLRMSSTKVNNNLAAHKLLCSFTSEHYNSPILYSRWIKIGYCTNTQRVILNTVQANQYWGSLTVIPPFIAINYHNKTQNSRAAPPNPVPVKENGYV